MPNELADAWEQFAEKHGSTAADAYRVVMQELMKGEGEFAERMVRLTEAAARLESKLPPAEVGAPEFKSAKRIDRSPTKRLELQLRQSEREAVDVVAKAEGVTAAQWVVGLIRAVLVKGVLAPSAELETLKQSTFQLMAIGRNLNQIAHHINADPTQVGRLHPARVEALAAVINEHRRKVEALVDRTLERWVLVQERKSRV